MYTVIRCRILTQIKTHLDLPNCDCSSRSSRDGPFSKRQWSEKQDKRHEKGSRTATPPQLRTMNNSEGWAGKTTSWGHLCSGIEVGKQIKIPDTWELLRSRVRRGWAGGSPQQRVGIFSTLVHHIAQLSQQCPPPLRSCSLGSADWKNLQRFCEDRPLSPAPVQTLPHITSVFLHS